jgi:hypothetical protein
MSFIRFNDSVRTLIFQVVESKDAFTPAKTQATATATATATFKNRTASIRHKFRKTIVLSCQRCLINTGVEKINKNTI